MKTKYQSVFISDLHLGTKKSKSKELLEFLDSFTCENLFLVGDIIDGWALQRRHFWANSQTEVLRKILKISEKSKVIYIPGNHDEFVRPFFKYNFHFGNTQITDHYLYKALDGRTIYVVHGDKWDFLMHIPKKVINFFAHFTDWAEKAKEQEISTARYVRKSRTELALRKYISFKKYDAVICGHTHIPKIENPYMNTGDWVQHCTAIVEHTDGTFELVNPSNKK